MNGSMCNVTLAIELLRDYVIPSLCDDLDYFVASPTFASTRFTDFAEKPHC